MELVDARAQLVIDRSDLPDECATQPIRSEQVHAAYAYACSFRDAEKLDLDSVTADASETYRTSKDAAGKSYTGERIALLLSSSPNVVNHRKMYAQAVLTAELWRGLVNSFQSRARMLNELVSLQLSSGALSVGGTLPYQAARSDISRARTEKP